METLPSRTVLGVIGWAILVNMAATFLVPWILFALAAWGMGWMGLRLGQRMRDLHRGSTDPDGS